MPIGEQGVGATPAEKKLWPPTSSIQNDPHPSEMAFDPHPDFELFKFSNVF